MAVLESWVPRGQYRQGTKSVIIKASLNHCKHSRPANLRMSRGYIEGDKPSPEDIGVPDILAPAVRQSVTTLCPK